MSQQSLSRKLLIQILSVYFILTFIVTLGQVYAEYLQAKNQIKNQLQTLQQAFSTTLSQAIWDENTQQISSLAENLLAIAVIEGVIIRDEQGKILTPSTAKFNIDTLLPSHLTRQQSPILDQQSDAFGSTFPLIFASAGRATQVGDVTLLSHPQAVFNHIKTNLYSLIVSTLIQATLIIILFIIIFKRQLTLPLHQFSQQVAHLEHKPLNETSSPLSPPQTTELAVIARVFNHLLARLKVYKTQLASSQQLLLTANNKLDQQNLVIEHDVALKTSGLSQAMIDLQHQKQKLEVKQHSLVDEIERRRETERALLAKQAELETSVEDLRQTQERLIQAEKMAALGGLVAGITHEINTPVGIGVTATSFLTDKLSELNQSFNTKTLTSSQLAAFIEDATQSTELTLSNLTRAAELIASFKQIAVDQTSEAIRTINLARYIEEIIRSLKPTLKKYKHHIEINCPDNIILDCPAGAISQIVTNLLMNSLIHAFDDDTQGVIRLTVLDQDNNIDIKFSDNGKGITKAQLVQLFDPFFTTKRNLGGSGLGAHITYNLVRQTLHGSIQASSEPGHGIHYHIRFPKKPFNAA